MHGNFFHRHEGHLLLEPVPNEHNSFIANINALVAHLEDIIQSNKNFDELDPDLLDLLKDERVMQCIIEIGSDLAKGTYYGNRQIVLDLEGILELEEFKDSKLTWWEIRTNKNVYEAIPMSENAEYGFLTNGLGCWCEFDTPISTNEALKDSILNGEYSINKDLLLDAYRTAYAAPSNVLVLYDLYVKLDDNLARKNNVSVINEVVLHFDNDEDAVITWDNSTSGILALCKDLAYLAEISELPADLKDLADKIDLLKDAIVRYTVVPANQNPSVTGSIVENEDGEKVYAFDFNLPKSEFAVASRFVLRSANADDKPGHLLLESVNFDELESVFMVGEENKHLYPNLPIGTVVLNMNPIGEV